MQQKYFFFQLNIWYIVNILNINGYVVKIKVLASPTNDSKLKKKKSKEEMVEGKQQHRHFWR